MTDETLIFDTLPVKFSTTTTATAEVLLDKETTPIKLDRPPSVTPDEVQELLTDAKSTVDSAHTIARYLWNDFDLLVPEARAVEAKVKNDKAASAEAAVEANVFIRLFVQQEKQWIAADATSIVTRSNLSKPPNFNYSHIVLHTDRFVVAIASDTPPSNDPISKKEAVLDDIQESGETTRWPTPPEQAILTAWQVTGHEHNQVASVVRGQAPVFGPHLEQPFTFGTFLGLAGDVASQPPAEGDTRSIDERCKAASDKIFALLNKMAQLRAECMPPMKKGQLLVGEAASRSQLIWNSAPSPTKLAFHALCAVANEKGSEHLMASYADHTLAFWDLTRPHLGPVVSAHLSGTRRRAVAMAVTSKFVVILDSGLKLTIVAYNSVALRVAASDRDNSAALLARIWNNAEDPLMLQLDMPLGFSLAANPSSPELFYLGTSHGYVFEMAVHTSAESMMALFHTRTFYTYTPDVVVAVSARNGRVLAQLSNEQLVLFHTTPSETESTESKHLCYVIDGTDKIQFRSATFAGSLIFAELTNRHLAVIDYLNPATNQRIIPTSLGATTSSDALRREFLESLMHVNSPEGYVRLAYGNMDIFTLQLPEFSEEIQQKILNPDTIM